MRKGISFKFSGELHEDYLAVVESYLSGQRWCYKVRSLANVRNSR